MYLRKQVIGNQIVPAYIDKYNNNLRGFGANNQAYDDITRFSDYFYNYLIAW